MRISNETSPLSLLNVPPAASWFMYNTFIEDQFVPWDATQALGGCEILPGEKSTGDNRGFGSYNDPYSHPWTQHSLRTGAMVKADFYGGGYLYTDKQVSPTWIYNAAGVPDRTRTASDSTIVFQNPTVSSNFLSLGISHEVGHPFCALGKIRYSLPSVKIWGSGTMAISGSRQPVPAHEALGLFTYSSGYQAWIPLWWGHQGDFWCLSGMCPSENISATYSSY